MQQREAINSYWILNLWEALTNKNNNNTDKYSILDIGKEKHRKIITNELLKPHLATFSPDDQQKICLSMQYVMKVFTEQQLLELLSHFGKTAFRTSSAKITTREFYMNIYHKLFTSVISINIVDYHDMHDIINYRDMRIIGTVKV